jgi:hypothetical protein
MTDWKARSLEDRMLLDYWNHVGGRIYTEVPLAGRGGHALWVAESTTRRLDAVRFPAHDRAPGIVSFYQNRKDFLKDVGRALS